MNRKIVLYGLLIISLLVANLPSHTAAQTEGALESGFHLIRATENGAVIEYALGEYVLEQVDLDGQTYDRVVLKDTSTLGEPGKPDLPVVATSIGVPINADFNLRIEKIQTRPLSGRYRIAPAGSYVVGDEALASGKIVYVEDQETYASATAYPGVQVELGQAAKLRSQRILPLRVFPFQFTPSNGQLEVVTYVRFVVEYNYPQGKPLFEAFDALAEEDNPFETLYQQSLLNYQDAKRYRAFEPTGDGETRLLAETGSSESYKITVTEDGIYKLTYEALQDAGMPVNTLDPRTFAMTNQGRPVAIYVHNSDGNAAKFSPDEYLLFFGERFDGTYLASLYTDEDDFWRDSFYRPGELTLTPFTAKFNHRMVEKYTNQNVYWLTYGGNGGPFMETVTVSPGAAPYLSSFRQSLRFEEQNFWWTTHFTSVDTFFWDSVQFSTTTQKNYPLIIPYPIQTGTATLRGEFVSRAHNPNVNPDHRQVILLNNNQIGTLTWDGLRRYPFELTFSATYLLNGQNTLTVEFQKVDGMTIDQVFVDWFEVVYERQMVALQNQLIFTYDNDLGSSVQISGFTETPVVLSIQETLTPKIVVGANYNSGILSFNPETTVPQKFSVAAPRPLSPNKVIKNDIVNNPAIYIYIAPREFINATQSLANYRSNKDGWNTKVVPLEDIIDQYNYGIYHPRAIKNYLQDVYDHWSPKPEYVLLVGDGHWNFLGSSQYDNPPNYMPPNLQWVDRWQGEVDAANDLVTVDGWDPLPDMMIGRLPVNNAQEILDYLTKVQTYENPHGQTWQKRFVFVADANDPTVGNFPLMMDKIIADYSIADYRKIYLKKVENNYSMYDTETTLNNPCGTTSGENQCPNATAALRNLLNNISVGHLVYSGHGYIDGWSKAVIFSSAEIQNLNNGNTLPFVFTLLCNDGYWYFPLLNQSSRRGQSVIELLVRAPNKGAIAAFSPTGLGIPEAHDILQRGFYNHIFAGQNWRLGKAALQAKLNVYTRASLHIDLVHTYTIFGDPALSSPSTRTLRLFLPLVNK